MTNEIEVNQIDERSKVLVESGFFPDLKSVAQAKVKVWIGRSLGLSEFQSLTGIYITPKGQIGLAAITMGSMIKASGKYDYSIDKIDDTGCSMTFYRLIEGKREEIGKSVFTDKDAAKCGLVNKDTYKNYPRNMLQCRALANGARWYCPETISGCYAIEELDDVSAFNPSSVIEITEKGEVVRG